MKTMTAAVAVIGVFAAVSSLRAQRDPQLDAVQRAVSIAEIQKTLDAFNIDRTSGKAGERLAAEYLVRKLSEYGVKHTMHEARLYMSWPVLAEITVRGASPLTIRGVTPAFGASRRAAGRNDRPDRQSSVRSGSSRQDRDSLGRRLTRSRPRRAARRRGGNDSDRRG